jgi:hypothetical protein
MLGGRTVACAAALFAVSCGAPLMKLPSGPGAAAPDAVSLLAEATSVCRMISTISTEVGVSGSLGGHRVRGRLLAGLATPASLYIEAPAPFGAPLFVLGASGGDATLLLPRDRRVLEHGRPEEVLAAVAGVPLDPAELRATLTGCVAGPDAASDGRSLGPDWRVVDGERTRYLRREHPAGPWRLVAVIRPGEAGWRADYRNFVNDLPRTVRLTSNQPQRFDLRLELSQVELNVDLQPSTFQISIPPGAAPISLDDLRVNGPLAR